MAPRWEEEGGVGGQSGCLHTQNTCTIMIGLLLIAKLKNFVEDGQRA